MIRDKEVTDQEYASVDANNTGNTKCADLMILLENTHYSTESPMPSTAS